MSQLAVCKGVATAIRQENGKLIVQYHDTDVVTVFKTGNIRLDTGGWFTATTKVRMNQASNQFGLGFRVYQADKKWFVRHNSNVVPFNSNSLMLEKG